MKRAPQLITDSDVQSPSGQPLREALRPSGPARIQLRIDNRPDAVVVGVEGELDILTAPRLAARLNGVIRASAADVVLDLRNVEFMDSAGLQILLNTRRRLLRDSRTLSVMYDDGPVKQVIELARLGDTLRVIDA
jgi:anti-sigma B factor antagonist